VDYVVYDTNIASLAIKVEIPASLTARLFGAVPMVSFVTVGELRKWAHLRSWRARRRGVLDGRLRHRPVINSSNQVADIWGRLAADTRRRGVPISENDTWIAACCLSEGLPLITRNVKDFTNFAEHHGLVLIAE
jgi:toxin FitB